ncbi:uncharacterized protein BO80DRAFT_179008 [Aspergillus ibericus CBS 121593]|uniref:LYR motif-containing protein Cup1-like N-terminal domain-containing protein n=1 Tax=Aspergillus ibericus CBS 121593 TaxID=1448316 RepID=A0A395GSH0_9EURO|nr:hypothetical protein BO80DRAFT_179008 [Aspergillus ibericus CBS 121593]RAK97908.1 hypothetical protein BO80DRAFT_179008 [Aspergillus ibericus CBS 121593]
MSTTNFTREAWLHLYRALIRQCSYLPDPIARVQMQAYILDRFRRSAAEEKELPLLRQQALRKSALSELSLLNRANDGYIKPLEKVLHLAYGRRGKRRHDLIEAFIPPAKKGAHPVTDFSDGWEPPSHMVALLKAQNHNAMITLLNAGLYVKETTPSIPSENIWGKPLSESRRMNIRSRWYTKARGNMFPPLPDKELKLLEGLILGTTPWTPPKRRKPVETSPTHVDSDINLALFLEKGPQKGDTFEKYADGRPHIITRRFMQRLWKRLSCLIPRVKWDTKTRKPIFSWDVIHRGPKLAVLLEEDLASEIFGGVDAAGKKIKDDKPQIEDSQSN